MVNPGGPALPLLMGIEQRSAQVAIVGLGYVGLPLAMAAAAAGFPVTGFDTEPARVEALARGESYILDIASEELSRHITSGKFVPTTDAALVGRAQIIVICVPTPLRNELPDMTYIEEAGKMVSANLMPGSLVILESTTYPGTTEEYLRETLESSGLTCGEDFSLGFSPERIDPGNTTFQLANVPKIVGGIDAPSSELMKAFYSSFVDQVVTVSSPKAAEMTKLLENTYRHVNIALANEMAILCHGLGIDVWEVIDAASTKPFGFHPFYPGPGWGGHCIPVDPAYLSWRVRQMHQTAHFVELSREINDRMPSYVVERIGDCLNEDNKSLKGSTVLVLGVAYKPDVSDVRESPALKIMGRLKRSGATVQFHDPYVDSVSLDAMTLQAVELDPEHLAAADLVVVITNHSSYDWEVVARHASLILDTRNALKGIPPADQGGVAGRIVRL